MVLTRRRGREQSDNASAEDAKRSCRSPARDGSGPLLHLSGSTQPAPFHAEGQKSWLGAAAATNKTDQCQPSHSRAPAGSVSGPVAYATQGILAVNPPKSPVSKATISPNREIWVKYNIFNLYSVDTVTQRFECRLNLELTWEEPLLNGVSAEDVDWSQVWQPTRVHFLNGHEIDFQPTYEVCSWESRPSGNAVVTCYGMVKGQFLEEYELQAACCLGVCLLDP